MLPNDYDPDAALGVRRDVLADATGEAANAVYQLRDMDVVLDGLAEDWAVFTDDEITEIRQLQRTVRALADSKERDLVDIREELTAVKRELRGP